ncbi:MAG: hypothetical protein K5756_07495 [Clostridiales bacterium]|nr:hypothetical protein [Clostridiales bacterium]
MLLNYMNVFFRVITFIGAYLKFTMETLFCRFFKIPPSIDSDNHSLVNFGHAVHYKMDHAPTQFLICFFPSLLMTVSGLVAYLSGIIPLVYLGVKPTDDFTGVVSYPTYIMYIVFTVIGVMMLSNVFPSITDVRTMYELIYVLDEPHPFVRFIAFLPCMYSYVGCFMERTGLITVILTAFPILMINLQK